MQTQGAYIRVIPRDLFNEASLLKCYARLWILLERSNHKAQFSDSPLDCFDIRQDESSGAIYINNIDFTVRGKPYRLERPLNSRDGWPLMACDPSNPDLEPVPVFDAQGNLSNEMANFISIGADKH